MEKEDAATHKNATDVVSHIIQLLYKDATCHVCQKIGHLAKVCRSQKEKSDTAVKASSKKTGVHHVQESDSDSDSNTDNALYSVFQLGGSGSKFLVSEHVNGVDIDMEVDSGAKYTTVPWSHFIQFLWLVCESRLTSVTFYQYKTPLVVKGECQAMVQVNN